MRLLLVCVFSLFLSAPVSSQQPAVARKPTNASRKLDAALLKAAERKDVRQVEVLLARGAHVNVKDNFGKTALFAAGCHLRLLKLLLDKEADVNARDNGGRTPLNWLCYSLSGLDFDQTTDEDPVAAVKLLLEHGADARLKDDLGNAPLVHAAAIFDDQQRATEIVHLLLKAGARVNDVDPEGLTALMQAAAPGSENDGAALRCNPETMKLLLTHGANIDARNKAGETALIMAAKDSEWEAAFTLLLNKGAAVNLKDKKGWTALMYAVKADYSIDALESLIKHGADVNAMSPRSTTALRLARKAHNSDAIRLLKEAGAKR